MLFKQLAFYLAILWAAVFLILCKGLRSFGKVIFIVGMLPLLVLVVITGKLLCVVDLAKLQVCKILANTYCNYIS